MFMLIWDPVQDWTSIIRPYSIFMFFALDSQESEW